MYERQLLDLLERGCAKEVKESELCNWIESDGKTDYNSYQMAINPASMTTPVRVVYNSSLKFRGQSLNTFWSKGPDLLNSLYGVLLRFREDYVATQGDIKKQFYQVRIAKEEQYMQLFL